MENSFVWSKDSRDRGPYIIIVICTVTATGTVFALARLYARGVILGKLHADDYLIVASVISAWVQVVLEILAVHAGMGRPFAQLTVAERRAALEMTLTGFAFGILSYGVPKLATVAFLTRVLNPGRAHAVFLWALAGVCLVQLLAMAAVRIATTRLNDRGEYESPEANVILGIYGGAFSAVTDFYLSLYPAAVVRKLRLSTQKRLAISVSLGLGILATAVSVVKCDNIPSLRSKDFTYDSANVVKWTCVEGSAIITASCIPSLKPILERVTGRLQPSSQRLSDSRRPASSRTRSRSKRTRTERTLFCIGSPPRGKRGDDEEIILQDCPSPASIHPDGAIIITRDYTVVREVATEDTPGQKEACDRKNSFGRQR